MWEISENLHRADLTKDERDNHNRRYAELLEKRRLISRQNDAKPQYGPACFAECFQRRRHRAI